MSKEIIRCDNCNEPMKFVQRLNNSKPNKTSPFGYRRRRFHCDICDINKTIYADGQFEKEVIPAIIKEDVNKMFKEQERNNER